MAKAKKIIVTSVRNEAPFLLEWVAYHRAIGFDRIVVVSNDCDDGTDDILETLARHDIISHLSHNVEIGASPQLQAARLVETSGLIGKGDWVIWLDADEFLNIRVGNRDVDSLIDAVGDRRGALINWRLFGDGGQVPFPGRFISRHFTRCNRRQAEDNCVIKTFFRMGDGVVGFQRAGTHRPLIAEDAGLTHADFLNGKGNALATSYAKHGRWLAGDDRGKDSRVLQEEVGFVLAQINHYACRTPEMYWLKGQRGRGWAPLQPDGANDRHTYEHYLTINANDLTDESILYWQDATSEELSRLESLEGMAKARKAAGALLSEKLKPFLDSDFAGKTITSQTFKLTLPDDAANLLKAEYAKAKCILEYGSGGSTFIAARNRKCRTMTVESDPKWAAKMRQALMREGINDNVTVHWCDIGPTKSWGMPKSDAQWQRYHLYPLEIWDLPDFEHPDLVLIDGRFRIGCFLACLFRSIRPMRVLWDDYLDREEYSVVEKYLKPKKFAGRMALFEMKPAAVPPQHLTEILARFNDFM